MKSENKVKKLVLRKETLRDLTAHNAGQVKGGGITGKGPTCPGYTAWPQCHITKGKPCH